MNKKLSTITHGLMVIDSESDDGESGVVIHFVGYWAEPTKEDVEHLYEELKNDEEFGLNEIIDRLIILPATKEVIEYYKNLENEEN